MSKFNKRDLIEQVSEKAHLSKKDATKAIEEAFDLIEAQLLAGNEVNITNFGVFTPKTRKRREGTDPKKHTRIVIDENRSITFRVSKALKGKLNK